MGETVRRARTNIAVIKPKNTQFYPGKIKLEIPAEAAKTPFNQPIIKEFKLPCFAGETSVWTVDGVKRIDKLQAGEKVWAFDEKLQQTVETHY